MATSNSDTNIDINDLPEQITPDQVINTLTPLGIVYHTVDVLPQDFSFVIISSMTEVSPDAVRKVLSSNQGCDGVIFELITTGIKNCIVTEDYRMEIVKSRLSRVIVEIRISPGNLAMLASSYFITDKILYSVMPRFNANLVTVRSILDHIYEDKQSVIDAQHDLNLRSICTSICFAVQYLHFGNFAHGRISLENIYYNTVQRTFTLGPISHNTENVSIGKDMEDLVIALLELNSAGLYRANFNELVRANSKTSTDLLRAIVREVNWE